MTDDTDIFRVAKLVIDQGSEKAAVGGRMRLKDAQRAIAQDWIAANQHFVGTQAIR
jgi:hypothetical protein